MTDETIAIETENEPPAPEDYPALKAELEAERQRAQALVAEATAGLTEKVASLEAELAAKQSELQAASGELEGAKAAYAYAVEDYKKLVLQANPLFTADIIWGTTIEELKASMEKASLFVGKVKEGLEAQAQAQAAASVVPAGAPARTGPDLSGLSTKEKINYGLEQAKKRKE